MHSMNLQALQLHAFLQKDTHFCFEILLTEYNEYSLLLLTKYEYTVSIGLCASVFEAGLSAAAPAEQLHTFFGVQNQ